MKIQALAERLGIPLVPVRNFPDETPRCFRVGDPPSIEAELWWWNGQFKVLYARHYPWTQACECVLHELLHAACGPESLKDEGALMAVQAYILQRLGGVERDECIPMFEEYGTSPLWGLGWSQVHNFDAWLKSESHAGYVREAQQAGLMGPKGYPSWRRLKNPLWSPEALNHWKN